MRVHTHCLSSAVMQVPACSSDSCQPLIGERILIEIKKSTHSIYLSPRGLLMNRGELYWVYCKSNLRRIRCERDQCCFHRCACVPVYVYTGKGVHTCIFSIAFMRGLECCFNTLGAPPVCHPNTKLFPVRWIFTTAHSMHRQQEEIAQSVNMKVQWGRKFSFICPLSVPVFFFLFYSVRVWTCHISGFYFYRLAALIAL